MYIYSFLNLPVGCNFTPDDEQTIKLHLSRKVRGFPLLWDGFAEKDLYGVDTPPPWVIFSDIDDTFSDDHPPSTYYHTETNKEHTITRKTVYVFTKLKPAASPANSNSKKGVRVSRRAGAGTWSSKSKPKKIVDSVTGNVIGHTKQLAFEHEGVDEQVVGHWIMHEYSLTAGWGNDFVLCKITRCTTHPAPPLPPPPIVDYDFEDIFFDQEEIAAILREPPPKKQKTTDDESENILMEQSDAAYAKELEEMLQEHGEDKGSCFADEYIWDGGPKVPGPEFTEENLQKMMNISTDGQEFLNISDDPRQQNDDCAKILLGKKNSDTQESRPNIAGEMLQEHGEDKHCRFAEDSWDWGLNLPDFAEEDTQKKMMMMNIQESLPNIAGEMLKEHGEDKHCSFAEDSWEWGPTLPD